MENALPYSLSAAMIPHQPVSTFGSLVWIGGGAHCDVLAFPAPRAKLRSQQLGRVDLDHYLGFEVPAGVHVHIRVRYARKAVSARMRAASVGIDRPVEREVGPGDVIDDRLGLDLDELDAPEVRGIESAAAKLEQLLTLHSPQHRTYVR